MLVAYWQIGKFIKQARISSGLDSAKKALRLDNIERLFIQLALAANNCSLLSWLAELVQLNRYRLGDKNKK